MAVWNGMRGVGALFFGALAGCGDGSVDSRPPIRVARIVRDFLSEPAAWEGVGSRPEGEPRVETVCPALSSEVDGADMPTLVLPPPGELRLEISADSIPSRLKARVGVDQSSFGLLTEDQPVLHVAFELTFGDRRRAREVIAMERGKHPGNSWRDLGGAEGVELTAAGTVTLRTEVLGPNGSPVEPPPALRAGFGGLRLERDLERPRTRSSPEEPNIVLVVMDTLRADRLSCYGYARPTSPRLDALARRGVLFESAYSVSSWTWPATATLLTGLTPMEHGVINEGSSFLIEAAETLAESLQQAGFTTAAWSANPIVSAQRNFDQGFERFHSPPERFQKTQELFEDVRTFLREQGGTRFFLYLHLADPHTPLRPLEEATRLLAADLPPGFAERSDGFWHATGRGQGVRADGLVALDEIVSAEDRARTSALYDASVWSGDHWLGELEAELAALGLASKTIVAFTADHGEELFERGILGHGQSLRRELVHVPLVIAGPGVPSARRHAAPLSTRLVAPLLARLVGVPFVDGDAALRTLTLGPMGEPVLFSTTKGFWKGKNRVRIAGLVAGDWKLDLAFNGAPWGAQEMPEGGDLELFDLGRDPGEGEDLSSARPAEAHRLRAQLLEQMEALEARRIGADIPAGGATLLMLRQLGYIGDDH